MRVCFDETASMYLNNVRVNGIAFSDSQDPWYLLGILNANVANFVFQRIAFVFQRIAFVFQRIAFVFQRIAFVFQRIAKVKAGGFFEANKQFIAPLPIPPASAEDQSAVAAKARALQGAHTARRDTLALIERRLSATRQRNKPETWLFPDLKTKEELISAAPVRLDAEERRKWADQRYSLDLAALHETITARLYPGASLFASFADGELSFAVDGMPVVSRIFVSANEGELIAAQWKVLAATFAITEKTDGKKLANALRKLAVADNPAVVQQIIALEQELSALEADIARQESEMNSLVYRLYGLSQADIGLVQRDRQVGRS
jgi:hypothetical protein